MKPIKSNAGLDVYEEVKKDHIYVTCVDVARGVEKDYSAFIIIDVTQLGTILVNCVVANPDIHPSQHPSIPRLDPSDLAIQVAHGWRPSLFPRFDPRSHLFFRRLPLTWHGKFHKLRHARLLGQIVAVAVRARPMPNEQVSALSWDGAHSVLEWLQVRMMKVATPLRLHAPRCDPFLAQLVQLRQRQRHPFGIKRVRPGRARVAPRPAAIAAIM